MSRNSTQEEEKGYIWNFRILHIDSKKSERQFARVNKYHNHINILKETVFTVHTYWYSAWGTALFPSVDVQIKHGLQRNISYFPPHPCFLYGWDTDVLGTWTAHNLFRCHKTHTSICSISLKQACGQPWARLCAGEIKMSNKHAPRPQRSHSPVIGRHISWNPRIQNSA